MGQIRNEAIWGEASSMDFDDSVIAIPNCREMPIVYGILLQHDK